MSVFGKTASAGALALALVASGPVAAQDQSPDDLAREGIGKIVSALELLLMTIPTYELPEVLPNGDIIIRRKNPRAGDGHGDEGGDEGGATQAPEAPKPI